MTINRNADSTISLFSQSPWREISKQDLAPATPVPTMLSLEESQLYYWLARDWATGAGAIVDLGCFAGGSTARLGAGNAASGRHPSAIVAYDRFTADLRTKNRILYKGGIAPFEGSDILLLAHRLLTPFKPAVELRPGELEEQIWDDGLIELLIIDIAKSAASADYIADMFFPHLIAGRSIVVQQDFLHQYQPWLPAQMTLLKDCFTPLARVSKHSMAFLCTHVPTAEAIKDARTGSLSDPGLTELLIESAQHYRAFTKSDCFTAMAHEVATHPNARTSWRLRQPPEPLSL